MRRNHAHVDALTFIGRTNFRNEQRPFGIREADRRAHMYIVGKTGTGKSTLIETLIQQDMRAGRGAILIDPHGDLVERVLLAIPEGRNDDLIYFNVPDADALLGFNPLERVPAAQRPLAASGLLEAFRKLWAEFWGPRSEHILRNALLALLEQPQATLADVLRLLDDRDFRRNAAERVANPHVRNFWLREYEGYTARFRVEAIAPIQNKVGAFLANPISQRILTRERSSFDLRRVMDKGKLLLVNLAKGRTGDDTARLIGALLVTKIALAAMSRADIAEDERRDCYVYLDEFQSYSTLSLASMLSELRKYRANLILAHQYISQLDAPVRDAILGNVGTIIAFRLGVDDAEVLEREFTPEVRAQDFLGLPNYNIYLKLMVGGVISRPFSAETIGMYE
jgi:type IV secretory pathway TraG/TraD family ATPase VirD4